MKDICPVHPKVLIVCSSFNPKTGGGITLSNMFRSWPKEKLIIATVGLSDEDSRYCSSILSLDSERKSKKSKRFRYINSFAVYRFIRNSIKAHSVIEKLSQLPINQEKFEEFVSWIEKENPDAIYALAGNDISNIPYLLELKRATKLPLVLHIVDDWISIKYFGIFEVFYRKQLLQRFRQLLDASSSFLCISSAMSREYLRLYEKPSMVMHNPVYSNEWQFTKDKSHDERSIKIFYTGSVEPYHIDVLSTMNSVLDSLNKKGYNSKLIIYGSLRSNHYKEVLTQYRHIDYRGFIAPEDLPDALKDCDILFLPMSFNKKNIQRTRLSMPTKVSQYMACPQPILLYAPKELAVTEYAMNEGFAYVVSEKSKYKLQEAIVKLGSDEKLTKGLVKKANELALKNHDAEVVCHKLLKTIQDVI